MENAGNGITEEIPGVTFIRNKMKTEQETEKNVYNESRDDEEIEAIPIEDITKLKEAFDFFDWNRTNTIATSVSARYAFLVHFGF